MAISAYVATGYPYDRGNSAETHEVSGRIVSLAAIPDKQRYSHTAVNTIYIRVIDFIVDEDDTNTTVEVWISGYAPLFLPTGGFTRLPGISPYKLSFTIPYSGDPDFKWGVEDPIPGVSTPAPGWPLRVTVKRKQ